MLSLPTVKHILALFSLISYTASIANALPMLPPGESGPRRLNINVVVIQYSSTFAPLEDLRPQQLRSLTALTARDDLIMANVRSILDFHGTSRYVSGMKLLDEPIQVKVARIVWAQQDLICTFMSNEATHRAKVGETIVFGENPIIPYINSGNDDGEYVTMIDCETEPKGVSNLLY